MINIKTKREFDIMRRAGALVRDVLAELEQHVRVGVTTKELNNIAEGLIAKAGAIPSFKGYNGFPAAICASPDSQVVHGIPSTTKLKEGTILSIDVGACVDGYHGDAARTFTVGKVSEAKLRLIRITEESFFKAIDAIKQGLKLGDLRVGDISHAVQSYVELNGYSVVRELVGHGIGSSMHEDPSVPNFGKAGTGTRITNGMALAIEPMVNMGAAAVKFYGDGWTVKTKDGLPSAHYENTVIIEDGEVHITTL